MEELQIRPAVKADRADLRRGLIELQNYECRLHDTRLPAGEIADPYLDWMLEQIRTKEGICLIAEVDGGFVGYVSAWVESDDNLAETTESKRYGYISDICVLDAWRGRRIAAQLLLQAERHLGGAGVTRLRISALAVNESALSAYRGYGFEPYEVTLEKRLRVDP
ncbi:MAG: GNAT family N-acetyltransferase [Dongiaceae bacterium]